jgi:hypothetical protein
MMAMAQFYFSRKTNTGTVLCLSPITDKRVELSGEEVEDRSGYFLYELRGGAEPSQVEILARVQSDEAAMRLKQMLKLE